MSIPAISKQIGKTKLQISERQRYQFQHTTTHFVRNEDLSLYSLQVMDTAPSDFDVPLGALCQSQSIVGCGSAGWIVTTVFGSGTYIYNLGNIVPENYQHISYSTGEFFCHARYWGLRIADESDVTAKLQSRKMAGDCRKGDLLQKGATSSVNGYGTFDMTECPIGSDYNHPIEELPSGEDANFDWLTHGAVSGLLNQKLATKILTVSYVASKSPHSYSSFIGINPENFSGTPSKFIPTQRSAGMWKAVRQSIEQINIKGNVRYKVTRIMESAPVANGLQTAWLLGKNGGFWTW